MSSLRGFIRQHWTHVLSYTFLVGAVIFLALAVGRQWADFTSALQRLTLPSVTPAIIAGVAAVFVSIHSWRESIAATSKKVSLRDITRAFLISQLGKYVPGSVWSVVVQVEMLRRNGISRAAGALGSTLTQIISLATAIVVGTVGVLLGGGSISTYWWLIPVAVACILTLVPQVLTPVMTRLGRLHPRIRGLETIEIQGSHLFYSVLWSLASWLFWGLQTWLLLRGLGYDSPRLLWFAIGAFGLSWAVGRVLVLAPGGVGPRDAALVAVLASSVSPGDALAVTIITRVVMALFDVIGAGGAAAVSRHKNRATMTP